MKTGLEESKKKNDELTQGLEKTSRIAPEKKNYSLRAYFFQPAQFFRCPDSPRRELPGLLYQTLPRKILLKINPTTILGGKIAFRGHGKWEK